MKKILAISFASFLIFGLFLFFRPILSQEEAPPPTPVPEEEEECQPDYDTSYYCTAGCDGELIEEVCEVNCGGGCTETVIEDCDSWQMCDAGSLSCACEGECLETPENPKYYDNPISKKDVGNSDITLPVKLDWDDVEGFGEDDGPQSYIIKITTSTNIFSKVLDESEYIPRACFFPSNKTSNWKVKACCNADQNNCGNESNWNLSTNLAPELISPYDPDWTGAGYGENISLPVTLDWCDVEEAQSYRLNIYIVSEDEKTCHPWLLKIKGGKTVCEPWLLEKDIRDRYQTQEILYSDFPDSKMDFFTRSTEYQWQLKTCSDEYGLNCQDHSQLWSFITASTTLPTASQFYPVDDPTGKNPVGLPLVLQWDDKPGMNSYYYEVIPKEGGATITGQNTTSQSLPLDYPQLALNKPYKWKVKGCWDYEAKKCETKFSQEWSFTTTGRPPQLLYPNSGADKIPIPLTLDWQDVSGAGSYVLKVQGDGLTLEKILNDSGFLMSFPEFNIRQEKNYSWQVKTCAWQDAKGACGSYSNVQNFKTFRMPPPTNPNPINDSPLSTNDKTVAWGDVAGAKAYQYQVKYLSLTEKEKDETCATLVGKNIFKAPITTFINSGFLELKCLGDYQWQVRACLDEKCDEAGIWSEPWSFSLVEPSDIANITGGFIPCGRSFNNPKTPWNEREPCQIKHLFLLIKMTIDFLLFKAVPIILVLLTIITGLIFYTSLGQIMAMGKVMSLWKAAGIGLAIIFLSWTIVNIFLKMVGYNIGVFGNWYELPL